LDVFHGDGGWERKKSQKGTRRPHKMPVHKQNEEKRKKRKVIDKESMRRGTRRGKV